MGLVHGQAVGGQAVGCQAVGNQLLGEQEMCESEAWVPDLPIVGVAEVVCGRG